ncbi:microcin C transport system substrate-binding protein [Yoonia tamlensis]|uniref:Microcin C transport system substrate-binding protein n=1 Tax=Yoonia tamlensis TaxID=390270 RepID=A0A1I6GS05_9RHOB|nr:extracellular solute-binding protein [Yoonia tamlensis]SFR45043.1 microcin C transport system substrate-binding protein [Yoonia tamlensis]
MQNRTQTRATALKQEVDSSRLTQVFLAGLVGVATLFTAQALHAQSGDTIIQSHGYNEYGTLKYPADFAHLDYVNPDAPIGGEVSISADGTFDNMNPFATLSGSPGAMASIMYERIMTGTDDEVGSEYCLLCKTVEYPQDQSWVIFHLRDDVTFSDGTPMTAHDVIYTHELLREQATPSYRAGIVALVESYEAIDDYTVKFTFAADAPEKGRVSQMGGQIVMSKAWFEETGARLDEARMETGPGTGEYMVGTIDPGRQLIYVRNPDYWGEDVPINVGRGNYDSIRIEYFADTSAAFEAFKAGEFTFRRENSSLNWATAYDFPALEQGWVTRTTLDDGTLPAATGFVFNLRREKFQDRNVRRALGLMYNFTWTNENLQYGLFQQRESFWENDRLKAAGLPEGRELEMLETVREHLPAEIFTQEALLPHVSGERALDRNNLRQALILMEAAGYTSGDDGLLRDANGNTLDVEFLETRQSFDRIINPYVENLQRLGVNITYNRVDPSQYQARTQENDFDMMFSYYVNGLVEGRGITQKFGCEDKDDVFNPAGYCSQAFDELAEFVTAAEDYDEMAAAVRAIDRIMRYEYYIVPVWYLGKNWVAAYDMYEHPENLPEFGLGYLDYWWINQDKAEALAAAGAFQ